MDTSASATDLHPCAMTIAGSDSGAGAGIQADLKAFSANGVYCVTAITLITAQNTRSMDVIYTLEPGLVRRQIETLFADFNITAVKTGALGNAEIIRAVARELANHPNARLVIDPIMLSKHGKYLLPEDAIETLKAELLPLAYLVAPNLPEAAFLAGMDEPLDRDGIVAAASRIAEEGCRAVLVKGGHGEGEPVDMLWEDGRVHWFTGQRIDTPHTHGTGCTFCAAITANLVKGMELPDAVRSAKEYLNGAILHGHEFGNGINPLNHFWRTQPTFGAGE